MSSETIDFENALQIATTIKENLARASKEASIVVVNKYGRPLVNFTMDHVRPVTANIALSKACQSSFVGDRTRLTRDQISRGERSASVLGIDPVPWAGGVPICDQAGNVIGGAGVSGLHEDEDEKYCIEGVEAVGFFSERFP